MISTFDGLKSYLDYAVTEDAKNSYAVLTTNIEGNSNSLTGRGANEHYYGTLDGLGYSISDVVAASRSGVFGGYIDGTIKNVAFDNLTTSNTSEDSNHGLFGIYLNKTASVNNVYVKATVSKPKMYRGLFRYNNPACQVSNIVADITYSDDNSAETTYVYGDSANDGWDAWYGNQLYAIGNADKQGGAGNNPVYATSEAFFNAEKANITAEKGFNDYWSKDGYSLSFGDTVIATAAKETKDAWYKTADFEVNLSSLLDGDTPEKMYVNGVETAIPAGNVYAVDWDALTKGEVNQVEVWGNGKIVVQPYMAVTHAIGNAEDMKAFLESYATTDSYATTGTESDGWYVVLTADFDMDGYVHNINYGGGTTWSGAFNGLGHTVANIEVRQGGLFGRLGVGAVIENTAFVGIKHIKDWYVLCNQAAGSATIRNLYFEGETTSGEAILIRGSKSGMTVSNVIMNFTNNGTKTNVSVFEEKATLKNLYGIGDFDKIKYSGSATGATLYGTVTEFFDKEQANITAENGWNEYWKIQEGGLYFGNTKVE